MCVIKCSKTIHDVTLHRYICDWKFWSLRQMILLLYRISFCAVFVYGRAHTFNCLCSIRVKILVKIVVCFVCCLKKEYVWKEHTEVIFSWNSLCYLVRKSLIFIFTYLNVKLSRRHRCLSLLLESLYLNHQKTTLLKIISWW